MRRQIFLSNGHPDAVAESLTERAGCRLNSLGKRILGMTRRFASPLAKLLELIERHVVTGQVKQAVQEHTAMTSGKNKPIAVGPCRLQWVISQVSGPEHISHWRGAHRHSGMAGIRLLNSIHHQTANGIDAE